MTWVIVVAIGIGVMVVVAVAGNFTGVDPIDRIFNPYARRYGESADGYIRRLASDCADRTINATDAANNACMDAMLSEARAHGYLP
ncbi:MAG: hypothetical protein M3071_12135 [Actinomycetota bacterium]|nr:hypothetical protein [Actinomycetota bacterium]